MKSLLAALLAAVLVYLLYDTWSQKHPVLPRTGRLCDYIAAGSVFEDVPTALRRGIRLLEVHIYSDERDQPVVATSPQTGGSNVAVDNVSFESVCVDIANEAFPSKDPLILSLVLHTDRTVTIDKVAEHLQTIPRKFLLSDTHIQTVRLDHLANKLLLVSGGAVNGTALEPLLNLNWSGSGLRRLSYQEAISSRDPSELKAFTESGLVLVAPDPRFKTIVGNPSAPLAVGCQWNLFLDGPPRVRRKRKSQLLNKMADVDPSGNGQAAGKRSKWLAHVKKTMKAHKGKSLKQVLKMAKKTYKGGASALSPGMAGGRRHKTRRGTRRH